MKTIAVALASGLYLSYIPGTLFRHWKLTGAGLIGTLWGVVLLSWVPLGIAQQLFFWVGVLLVSVVTSQIAEKVMQRIDDPRIVIDETIGYLTTMLWLPHSVAAIIAGFVLFRLFDIWKPAGIKTLSKWPGGWGVVMDDVLAGVYANIILRLAHHIYPL